jgi:hypothetical protein
MAGLSLELRPVRTILKPLQYSQYLAMLPVGLPSSTAAWRMAAMAGIGIELEGLRIPGVSTAR